MAANNTRTIRPANNKPVLLSAIAERFQLTAEVPLTDIAVTGITLDSRDVRAGDLYVGMPGALRHGAQFWPQAKALGAVAMLTDEAGWKLVQDDLPVGLVAEHPRSVLGQVAAFVYDTDSFDARFFGVTGTNGKTSVIYMLAALLDALGISPGISSTAERRIGDEVIVSSLTSPEASELHGLLARMREVGVGGVAIEVSAQAVVRHRIDGVLFDVVAFNNFSQDHLDEFGSMEKYFAAKAALFTPEHARRGVVVVDAEWGRRIAAQSSIPVTTLATEYGAAADWHLAVTRETLDGTSFVLSGPNGANIRASVPVVGRFMAENAALAMVMLVESGITPDDISAALGSTGALNVHIPGRLEKVSGEDGPRFLVDYGHTPGSFEVMLEALQRLSDGRVIMMFGADGDRDTTKREAMGAIAARGSDVLIVCDYNPRTEDPAQIRAALLEGARNSGAAAELLEVADPATAIREAIKRAEPNDVILYAGPGHEEYREVAGSMIPFSARDEVRKALREAGYNA